MYTQSLMDYDGEKTSFRLYTEDLTAANFDAQVSLKIALETALLPLVLGEVDRSVHGQEFEYSPEVTDEWAQRELKWRVDFVDDVNGEPGHFTIGTANTEKLNPNARGVAHIGDGGDVDAFVTALQNFAQSRDGNSITVQQILLVGRNI